MDGSQTVQTTELRSSPLLFEMLRSFTTLAETLNLSRAVRDLGSTRQTVRRHIAQLEEIKGGALFEVKERQYLLTSLGATVLPEALDLLARAESWLFGQSQMIDGMQYLNQQHADGWCFFQHQQPIGKAFASTGPMLPNVLEAWAKSGGKLEEPALQDVRPYCNVFRKVDSNWLFTEVGEQSSFVSWFGWAIARSTIGRVLGAMPGGDSFGRMANASYLEVEANQSVRLDHIYTVLPKGPEEVPTPICYERLLLGAKFPDDSFAMISAVRRTYDVDIMGVSHEMKRLMPEDMVM